MVCCVYRGLGSLLHKKAEDRLLNSISRSVESLAGFFLFCLCEKTSLPWRRYWLRAEVSLLRSHLSLNIAAGLTFKLISHGVLVELTFVYLISVYLIQVLDQCLCELYLSLLICDFPVIEFAICLCMVCFQLLVIILTTDRSLELKTHHRYAYKSLQLLEHLVNSFFLFSDLLDDVLLDLHFKNQRLDNFTLLLFQQLWHFAVFFFLVLNCCALLQFEFINFSEHSPVLIFVLFILLDDLVDVFVE